MIPVVKNNRYRKQEQEPSKNYLKSIHQPNSCFIISAPPYHVSKKKLLSLLPLLYSLSTLSPTIHTPQPFFLLSFLPSHNTQERWRPRPWRAASQQQQRRRWRATGAVSSSSTSNRQPEQRWRHVLCEQRTVASASSGSSSEREVKMEMVGQSEGGGAPVDHQVHPVLLVAAAPFPGDERGCGWR